MTILAQQSAATFHIWDGELVLWQPEEATQYWPRTEYTARYAIPPETCPWTDEMVQELWTEMLTENDARISPVMSELSELEEFHDLIDAFSMDITGYSYFNEWNQSVSRVAFICDVRGIAQKFTPEMLIQRDNLNDMWNANCQLEDENPLLSKIWGGAPIDYVPDSHCTLAFVSIGEKFGVAKCEYGSTYVPKSSINHIKNLLGREPTVGQMFGAWICFTGAAKYPWKIESTVGVTKLY